MELNREQAIDILEKFDFFQGQRAGRELWCIKPIDVQEQDIANFSRDVALLKNYINEITEENESLTEELAKAYVALDNSMNFYCSFTKSKIQNCPIEDEVSKAKADAVREFAERLKDCIHPDADYSGYDIKRVIEQIANDMGKQQFYKNS